MSRVACMGIVLCTLCVTGCGNSPSTTSAALPLIANNVDRTLLPVGHTGLVVVANALSCGLDGYDIQRLNDIHNGGLPVNMVLLTPGLRNTPLANEVAADMGLVMPHQVLASSEFADMVSVSMRTLPAVFLLKDGRIRTFHSGNVSQMLTSSIGGY